MRDDHEALPQQVLRNAAEIIDALRGIMFLGSDDGYSVLVHQLAFQSAPRRGQALLVLQHLSISSSFANSGGNTAKYGKVGPYSDVQASRQGV